MKKGFVTIFVIVAFLIAISLGVGVFYYKTGGFRNFQVKKNLPISINSEKSWKLIDHTNQVSFNKELDEKSFISMKSNGDYWLLGRGHGTYSPSHFYRYSRKEGFENISAQFSDLHDIWHIAWNGEYWLLGNANYVFTNSLLVKWDGKEQIDLTDRFKKTPCESTYEGHINISKIFVLKSAFLIVSLTDLTSCYAIYDGDKFQNVSELFPVYPPGSSREGDRQYYNIGDCSEDICYLSNESGGDHIVRFVLSENKVEKIPISNLSNGEVEEGIVSRITLNSKDEWLLQMGGFKNESLESFLISFNSMDNDYKVINQSEIKVSDKGLSVLFGTFVGWDDLISKWVVSGFDCSADNKKLCRLVLSHFAGNEMVQLPLEFPQSEETPTISIANGSYFVSYDDKLFEVLYK